MTRLLLKKGIPFDTPIAGYLPTYWAKGPNIGKIMFRQLMTHTSGLNFKVQSSASDFAFMKSKIAAGTTHLGEYSVPEHELRALPDPDRTLNGNVSPGATFTAVPGPNGNDVVWDYVTIEAYAKYVRDNVFAPAGVVGPTLGHTGSGRARIQLPASRQRLELGRPEDGERRRRLAHVGRRAARRDGHLRRSGTIMSAAHAQRCWTTASAST